MSRLVKILLASIPVIYLAAIPFCLSSFVRAERCGRISIDIDDSSDFHFVTKQNLANLVNAGTGRLVGKPVKDIALPAIEEKLQALRELLTAEVYISADGTLHVYADQRDPVVRVMPESGGDFFLDDDGVLVRKRNLYNPRLHIAGGNITLSESMLNGMSVFDTSIKKTVLRDIYNLVRYIDKDDFWSAQIDQIHVDGDDEIDLVPRVGNQIIHLGTTENLEEKLENLEAFYDNVLPEVGWNKYSVIDLEYRGQIVCKKRDNQN